jgi:hypothetical protein
LSTTEIIPAICDEKKKTGQIAGRYNFPLAVFWKGCFLAGLCIVWYPIGPPEAIMGQYPDWGCAGKCEVIDPF